MHTFDREDLLFQLFNVANAEQVLDCERYSHLDKTTVISIIDAAEQLAADFFEPIARKADEHEPEIVDGKVKLIPEAKTAINAYLEAGFMGTGFTQDLGGSDLPEIVIQAAFFILGTANVAYTGYGLLTTAAGRLLAKYASEEQKQQYLLPMVEGRFFATMCLSEPHAGSSLADIRTSATLNEDDSYAIAGNKMWISNGDHELSENIVHLVMAKIPGGPEGVKGISLFIVPKYKLDENGNSADANDVTLAGLNHKMGYKGITNCALNFGENNNCTGYLVGEEHRGLSYMFHMMNEARIFVGVGATALGQAGFQVSLDYARERPQGRHPDSKDANAAPVPIIEHADIRRLLLAQKAAVEPSLALGLYCAKLVDITRSSDHEETQQEAALLLEMLTPITKSWPSEFCLEANKHAIQILGGAGYTRDYPLERYYRDNRLNPIHEGTHGIQGLDFLGRKSRFMNGQGVQLLAKKIIQTIDISATNNDSVDMAAQLRKALDDFETVTKQLTSNIESNPRAGLANATLYLDMAGHIVMAWMHLRILNATVKSDNSEDFIKGKYQSARYFFNRELVRTIQWSKTLKQNESSALLMQSEWF